jgi:hypothetical protein
MDENDDTLWDGGGNIKSECEEDEGTDCENVDVDTDW